MKSGLKQEKSSVRPFQTTLKFLHEERGGIGGPNPPNGGLGSPVKLHGTSLEEIKLQSSCMFFYDYFCVVCTGRRT